MSKLFARILSGALCAILFFCLSSCSGEDAFDDEDNGDYYDGYVDGYNDAVSENDVYEAYRDGYNDAYYRFEDGVLSDAIDYVQKYSKWHPEEALYIIDAYESGELAFGKMELSEDDYKEAINSLYLYYEYFYNSNYYDVMNDK